MSRALSLDLLDEVPVGLTDELISGFFFAPLGL